MFLLLSKLVQATVKMCVLLLSPGTVLIVYIMCGGLLIHYFNSCCSESDKPKTINRFTKKSSCVSMFCVIV